MDGKIEQHVCIKFCMKLSKSTTLEACEAFDEHSLSRTAVFEWHSHFKASRVSVEDERLGRPSIKYKREISYKPVTSAKSENLFPVSKM
jgi:hypothetical protein